MRKSLFSAATIVAAIVATQNVAPAFAAGPSEVQEENALTGAKLTLADGIAAAERRTKGHAFDAGVLVVNGRTRIVVETKGDAGVQTVSVDAITGDVVDSHAGGEPD